MPRDGRTLPHNILEEMRFRAIEAYQAGKGVAEIAKLLGVHWGSVSRWLTKWRRDGQRALKERKATGRPPKFDCKRHGKAILKLVNLRPLNLVMSIRSGPASVSGKLSALN